MVIRKKTPSLRPDEERRLAKSAADLERSSDAVDESIASVQQLIADVDENGLCEGGIVLEPLDDGDSLAIHVDVTLRGLHGSRPGSGA